MGCAVHEKLKSEKDAAWSAHRIMNQSDQVQAELVLKRAVAAGARLTEHTSTCPECKRGPTNQREDLVAYGTFDGQRGLNPAKEPLQGGVAQAFSEGLAPLSVSERIRALALIYSSLTVCTRQLFLPDMQKGKEQAVINMLHGVNELHHTLADWLVDYATDESKAFPVHSLSQQLLEIANQYRIGGCLTSAVEFARTRNWTPKT